MNLLELSNITILYDRKTAVDNVSFNIPENDYLSIVGYNGSGKSSIIKSMVGLVNINSGNIKYNISKNDISYLPQTNKIPLNFPASVFEIVLTGTQKNGFKLPFYSNNDRELAQNALKDLKMQEFSNKRIGDLSGGQLQRALLARALAKRPKLLILDEPCSGLDESVTKNFYSLLNDLNKNQNITIVMVSHDMENVLEYSKSVLLMNKTIKFWGPAEEWKQYRKEGGLL